MKLRFLYFLFFLTAISAFLHFWSDKFPDPDVFYHFRHADLYWQNGLTVSDFPWTFYSVINKFSSDIWYGFHLFLIPFTWFENEIFGFKISEDRDSFIKDIKNKYPGIEYATAFDDGKTEVNLSLFPSNN